MMEMMYFKFKKNGQYYIIYHDRIKSVGYSYELLGLYTVRNGISYAQVKKKLI